MVMRHRCLAGALALALAVAACDASDGLSRGQDTTARTEIERQLGRLERADLDTAAATRLSGAFRGAASEAIASVVQIEVIQRGVPEAPPGPFHRFIEPDTVERVIQGNGSGFIIDERGHILTNHHVVQNAIDVRVRMVDGREFEGEVVGSDPNSDVAVIRVRAPGPLPVSKLANSDELKVGDWVLALGSPLELRFSVTAGIVSALNRSIQILNSAGAGLEAFIQTDAAINPGNSGGPLVDLMGRVVGVNSAIETQTGYFSGAGFAIPINLAHKLATDLIKYGEVHRPRLGVSIRPVTAADAAIYKLPVIGGVEIQQVTPGEAAERAGVKMGDVVLAVGGKPVDNMSALQATVAQLQPGQSVKLSIIRYGERMEIPVKLGAFEPARAQRAERAVPGPSGIGFMVIPLPVQYAERVGRKGRRDVPVVRAVDPLSPAAAEQLRAGYAILSVNGKQMSVAELRRFAARVRSGDVISLVVASARENPAIPLIINYRVP